MLTLLVLVIVFALIFDYINGFHDAANAIATVVSTGVLPVRTAVLLAALLNFVGACTGTAVAKTIASGFADPALVTQVVVLATLVAASLWNLLTWWLGIPSSSSHALIGALAGAVVARGGVHAFSWGALYKKVLVPLVSSPAIGFFLGLFLMIGMVWLLRRARTATVHVMSRRAQLLSSTRGPLPNGPYRPTRGPCPCRPSLAAADRATPERWRACAARISAWTSSCPRYPRNPAPAWWSTASRAA